MFVICYNHKRDKSLSDSQRIYSKVQSRSRKITQDHAFRTFRTLNYIFIMFIKIKMYTPYCLSDTCISFCMYVCMYVCIAAYII